MDINKDGVKIIYKLTDDICGSAFNLSVSRSERYQSLVFIAFKMVFTQQAKM